MDALQGHVLRCSDSPSPPDGTSTTERLAHRAHRRQKIRVARIGAQIRPPTAVPPMSERSKGVAHTVCLVDLCSWWLLATAHSVLLGPYTLMSAHLVPPLLKMTGET